MQEILRDEFDDPEFLAFAIENYKPYTRVVKK